MDLHTANTLAESLLGLFVPRNTNVDVLISRRDDKLSFTVQPSRDGTPELNVPDAASPREQPRRRARLYAEQCHQSILEIVRGAAHRLPGPAIYDALRARHGDSCPSWHTIANMLSKMAKLKQLLNDKDQFSMGYYLPPTQAT